MKLARMAPPDGTSDFEAALNTPTSTPTAIDTAAVQLSFVSATIHLSHPRSSLSRSLACTAWPVSLSLPHTALVPLSPCI